VSTIGARTAGAGNNRPALDDTPYPGPVERPRSRDAARTRADLLAAARRRFGSDGYERTAADLNLNLPDLAAVPPDQRGEVLLARFFAVWEDDETFLALLRAAMTSESIARTMRNVFITQVAPAFGAAVADHPRERAGLLGAFIIGLATTRYALAAPGVAAMSQAELTAWAAPVINQLLTGPVPGQPSS
jgi:hypothetical protein